MLMNTLGKSGLQVSAVGMGTWNIGGQWGHVAEADAFATIRAGFDAGMRVFDAAESYGVPHGRSEELLGLALTGIRHQITLVTKIGNWGKREGDAVPKTSTDLIRLCVHACLFRLRTDWLDVLLCHEGNIEDPSMYLETFRLLKQQGLIRACGISTDDLAVLKRFNQDGDCDVVQLRYSLLNRQAEDELLPYCREHNIGVMVRGPLAQGLLSGKYDAESRFAADDMIRHRWNPGQPGHDAINSDWRRSIAVGSCCSCKGKGRRQHNSGDRAEQSLDARADVLASTELVTAALRFGISHPDVHCSVPGARSTRQAAVNAAAGQRRLSMEEHKRFMKLTSSAK